MHSWTMASHNYYSKASCFIQIHQIDCCISPRPAWFCGISEIRWYRLSFGYRWVRMSRTCFWAFSWCRRPAMSQYLWLLADWYQVNLALRPWPYSIVRQVYSMFTFPLNFSSSNFPFESDWAFALWELFAMFCLECAARWNFEPCWLRCSDLCDCQPLQMATVD